jgi:hypothetical protein
MQKMVKREKFGKRQPKPETLISQLNVPDAMKSWSFIPILTDYIIIVRVVVYICALDKELKTGMWAVFQW